MGLLISLMLISKVWGLTTQQIAKKTFPAVVLLVMEDANGQPISIGSGFFVREGVVATNFHVVEKSTGGYAKVVGQKKKHNISGIVGINQDVDLVLLSVAGVKTPSLPLGNSGQVQVGDEIYAVGNPLGLEGTFSKGIVSSIRSIGSETIFQLTAPISPGSSGGPILDTQGKVIGIAVATFEGGQNLNFAIPVYFLNLLLSNTTPVKPLSIIAKPKGRKSIFSNLGERNVEGVVGYAFDWGSCCDGHFYFSIRNKLRDPVKNIGCLVIVYDDLNNPLDFGFIKHRNVIPGQLAKRVGGSVSHSTEKLLYNSRSGSFKGSVEVRVLGFEILE